MRKRISPATRILGWLWALSSLAPAGGAAADPVERIVVVRSSDNVYYGETIDSLRRELGDRLPLDVVASDALAAPVADAVERDLYIALGLAAVEAVDRAGRGLPALQAYLTREQFDRLARNQRRTTVLLDQPLERYLAFCKFLLDADAVGVLSPQALGLDSRQRRLLQRLGLELNRYRVDADNKLLPVLRRLLRHDDALLMLPRQALYNRDSLKGVLLTVYRSRKPAISYSPAHVRAGALASIHSSPSDIGRHLARLVEQRLRAPLAPAPPYEYARFYTIATNSRVAHALGLRLPDPESLRRRLDEID